ncbi:unnamed protein product, partial [Meganyctiphanes norvegica]
GPRDVQYGDPAIITCTVYPAWPVKVTWYRNDVEIPRSDRFYIQSAAAELDDNSDNEEQGRYDNDVGNGENNNKVWVATLQILSNAKNSRLTGKRFSEQFGTTHKILVAQVESLTAEPNIDLVEYGDSLTFTCTVSGTDDEILWLKDGSQMEFGFGVPGRQRYTSEPLPGQRTSTIHIESLSFSDNGQYVCYVPGASKNILINLEGRPSRLIGVTGSDFAEFDYASIACRTKYAKDPEEGVEWLFEGSPLFMESAFERSILHEDHNVTVHELIIASAWTRHEGTYTCRTPYGEDSIKIYMYQSPIFDLRPLDEHEALVGDEVQFTCSATGHPEPLISWEKQQDGSWISLADMENVKIDTPGVISLGFVTKKDEGLYRCLATSAAGTVATPTKLIIKPPPPKVWEVLIPDNVIEGSTLNITCVTQNW